MGDLNSFIQEFGAVGGGAFLVATNALSAVGAYKMAKAATRKAEAETRKIDAEAAVEVAKVDADFEKALNERVIGVIDTLKAQVDHLSDLVESQSKQLSAQSEQMQHMENEIRDLRIALDAKTRDLSKAFPPICRRCEFYNGTPLCDRSKNGGVCKYEKDQMVGLMIAQLAPPVPSTEDI